MIATNDEGIAIGGYDPVSYHQGAPELGLKELETEWLGARWRFASAANRDAFVATPGAYAPQYGGHCELAMRFGKAAHADPRSFRIVDGRLYLSAGSMVRMIASMMPGLHQRADRAWSRLGDAQTSASSTKV